MRILDAIAIACIAAALPLWAGADTAAELPPETPPSATATAAAAAKSNLVTNIWVDTDIRQVVQDMASQTETVILCDQTVQGVLSMSVKDMPLGDCLERVCASGGFSFTQVKDYYLIGKAEPGMPLFQRLSDPKRIKLANVLPEQVKGLL